jgi:hypothetical protein
VGTFFASSFFGATVSVLFTVAGSVFLAGACSAFCAGFSVFSTFSGFTTFSTFSVFSALRCSIFSGFFSSATATFELTLSTFASPTLSFFTGSDLVSVAVFTFSVCAPSGFSSFF